MRVRKAFIAVLSAAILAVGITTVLPAQSRPQPAAAQQAAPFDHSQCQYPDRTTNPADGCDNSDPCDPASAAKGGSGDCAPVGTAEKQQAIAEHDAAFQAQQPVNQCGGSK